MPDNDTQTTTDNGDAGQSDKEKNWKALEADRDRWKELAEKRAPLEHAKSVQDAGFDPNTAEGKALTKFVESGQVQAEDGQELPDAISKFAEDLGWKPGADLSDKERETVDGSKRLDSLNSASTSEQPPPGGCDCEAGIAAARSEDPPNYVAASRIQTYHERTHQARAG